jgi:hypothetical protein
VPLVNPAAEGSVYPSETFEVTPARVAAFRTIFGQTVGVPATFATAAEFEVLHHVVDDPELKLDFSRVVHGEQRYEHRRQLREGETLTATVRIESVRFKGVNGFLQLVTDLVDAEGQIVCVARSLLIERGAG